MGIPAARSLDPSLELTPLRALSMGPPVKCVLRMAICAIQMVFFTTEMIICASVTDRQRGT
ncbi:unnamed protein product, partial [Rotaria socialis]